MTGRWLRRAWGLASGSNQPRACGAGSDTVGMFQRCHAAAPIGDRGHRVRGGHSLNWFGVRTSYASPERVHGWEAVAGWQTPNEV
jgi:hypothetical protein